MTNMQKYSDIQKLKISGMSRKKAAKELNICSETVRKYWNMQEYDYATYLFKTHKLSAVRKVQKHILRMLIEENTISAATIHERLYPASQAWSYRTTARFIKQLRDDYGLRK